MCDLRQKELKLRKFEKDLSLREKLLNENSKDRTRLETYTMKLEARNNESEQTVRTLQWKIDVLEQKVEEAIKQPDSITNGNVLRDPQCSTEPATKNQ